jgi:hypothetical protein
MAGTAKSHTDRTAVSVMLEPAVRSHNITSIYINMLRSILSVELQIWHALCSIPGRQTKWIQKRRRK